MTHSHSISPLRQRMIEELAGAWGGISGGIDMYGVNGVGYC